MNFFHSFLLSCLVVLLLGTTGCSEGPPVYDAEGIVTYQGVPLAQVDVKFTPVDGRRGSIGRTDETGKFMMWYTGDKEGVLDGEHTVTIGYNPSYEEEKNKELQSKMKKVIAAYGAASEASPHLTVDRDVKDLKIELK